MTNSLSETILKYDRDSTQVLLTAVRVIKEFEEHVARNTNETTFEKAIDTCMDIVVVVILSFKKKKLNQYLQWDTLTEMLGSNSIQLRYKSKGMRWRKDPTTRHQL